jgi:hypothetical protein
MAIHVTISVAAPGTPPKPDDDFAFCFSVESRTSGKEGARRTTSHTARTSKKASEIFPESFFAPSDSHGSASLGPTERVHLKSGQEKVIVEQEHFWREQNQANGNDDETRYVVRYRVTVKCLGD